jgi:hypothetical protein
VALVPNPASSLWAADVPRSTFFEGGGSARLLADGDTVLVLPYGSTGWSMLWQAEDDLRYQLVGGHIGRRTTVAEASWIDVYRALAGTEGASIERVRDFIRTHHVDVIVVAPGARERAARLIASLGIPPERVGDALVYRLA